MTAFQPGVSNNAPVFSEPSNSNSKLEGKPQTEVDKRTTEATNSKLNNLYCFSQNPISGQQPLVKFLIVGAKLAVLVARILGGGPKIDYSSFDKQQAGLKEDILRECTKDERALRLLDDFVMNPEAGIKFRTYADFGMAVQTNNLKLLNCLLDNKKDFLDGETRTVLKEKLGQFQRELEKYDADTPKTWK